MKLILIALLACPFVWAEDNAEVMKELNRLKSRVEELEKKDSGKGFKSTDYSSKTTESTAPSTGSETPQMTEEQRKEIMATVEKYKKAQAEQEKALKELENDE